MPEPTTPRPQANQLRPWNAAEREQAAAIVPAKIEPLLLARATPKMRDLLQAGRADGNGGG